tara:strand:+ start:181 stop:699 length:519 start_codon:yes stop_codon:yes gene_type:complete
MEEVIAIQTVRANPWKAFAASFVSYFVLAVIIAVALYLMNFIIDFQLISDSLAFVGFSFNHVSLYKWLLIILGIFVVIVSLLNTFLSTRKKILRLPQAVVVNKERIPLKQVVAITFDKPGLAKLFKAGSVHLQTTGTEHKEVVVSYVDDVELQVHQIEEVVERAKNVTTNQL